MNTYTVWFFLCVFFFDSRVFVLTNVENKTLVKICVWNYSNRVQHKRLWQHKSARSLWRGCSPDENDKTSAARSGRSSFTRFCFCLRVLLSPSPLSLSVCPSVFPVFIWIHVLCCPAFTTWTVPPPSPRLHVPTFPFRMKPKQMILCFQRWQMCNLK